MVVFEFLKKVDSSNYYGQIRTGERKLVYMAEFVLRKIVVGVGSIKPFESFYSDFIFWTSELFNVPKSRYRLFAIVNLKKSRQSIRHYLFLVLD